MQLICEGLCNYGRVQELDEIVRRINRTKRPEDHLPRLTDPAHLKLAHQLRHTEHAPVGGSAVFFACLACGTTRRYGWIEPPDRVVSPSIS